MLISLHVFITTVLAAKSDSDVVFCLQMFSKILTYTRTTYAYENR